MFGELLSESPRLPSPWQATPPLEREQRSSPASLHRQLSLCNLLMGVSETLDSICVPNLNNEVDQPLTPECDEVGNIEYKLKLPNPSPLRLQKLTTQLKWRVIQGGGRALYELGVLDDGSLIGLSRVEMTESLATLSKMLSGIGGGEVRIGRVVRLGDGTNSADDDDSDEFETIQVEPELDPEPDVFSYSLADTYHPPALIQTTSTLHCPRLVATTSRIDRHGVHIPRQAPNPQRTPEEQLLRQKMKRELRRQRRESAGEEEQQPHHSRREGSEALYKDSSRLTPTSAPSTIQKVIVTKPIHVKGPIKFKPVAAPLEGETRYVVEAIVVNRSVLRKEKANIREGVDEDNDLEAEEDEDEDGDGDAEEGWNYLDFGLI